jgi:hypothetical protein
MNHACLAEGRRQTSPRWVAARDVPGPNVHEGFTIRKKGRNVTYVVLIIVAALLIGGLWYIRGRRT